MRSMHHASSKPNPIGAEPRIDGTSFRVWATACDEVELVLGRTHLHAATAGVHPHEGLPVRVDVGDVRRVHDVGALAACSIT